MNVQYNSLLCIDNIGLQLIIEINWRNSEIKVNIQVVST